MKLRNRFTIYAVGINLLFALLILEIFFDKQLLFIFLEVLWVISVVSSYRFYRAISTHISLISHGVESIRDKDFGTRLLKTGSKDVDQLIDVYNQMINHLREARIKNTENNHFLEKLLDASSSGVVMVDSRQNIMSMNVAAGKMLDIDPGAVRGKTLQNSSSKLLKAINSMEEDSSQILFIGNESYKCQKRRFTLHGHSHYFILLEELTKDIYQKEKKAYEKVVKVMSHELNNSIGAINSMLNSFLNYTDQIDSDARKDYENGLSLVIKRNSDLINIMRNFAQVVNTPKPVKAPVDIVQMVSSMFRLMNSELQKKSIRYSIQHQGEKAVVVDLDSQQIELVLINVVKNSIEAISGEGEIIVEVRSEQLELSIKDNGCGIVKDSYTDLFSPFFSTKKNGQGIGLTLSREILHNHDFAFSLETVDGWTEFLIKFNQLTP